MVNFSNWGLRGNGPAWSPPNSRQKQGMTESNFRSSKQRGACFTSAWEYILLAMLALKTFDGVSCYQECEEVKRAAHCSEDLK